MYKMPSSLLYAVILLVLFFLLSSRCWGLRQGSRRRGSPGAVILGLLPVRRAEEVLVVLIFFGF
jgi:hypothetical protein